MPREHAHPRAAALIYARRGGGSFFRPRIFLSAAFPFSPSAKLRPGNSAAVTVIIDSIASESRSPLDTGSREIYQPSTRTSKPSRYLRTIIEQFIEDRQPAPKNRLETDSKFRTAGSRRKQAITVHRIKPRNIPRRAARGQKSRTAAVLKLQLRLNNKAHNFPETPVISTSRAVPLSLGGSGSSPVAYLKQSEGPAA